MHEIPIPPDFCPDAPLIWRRQTLYGGGITGKRTAREICTTGWCNAGRHASFAASASLLWPAADWENRQSCSRRNPGAGMSVRSLNSQNYKILAMFRREVYVVAATSIKATTRLD